MENHLKQVCQCILQASNIQNIISDNRLSHSQVSALMEMVDIKHRGYLDLNDIFQLVGKVTESELFAIFKYLDCSRTGQVRVPDLQQALGNSQLTSSNTTKEYIFPRFYKIVDTIKDRPKLIRDVMKQYNCNANSLKTAYQYICELVKSKYLSQEELITVFKSQFIKNGLKWTAHCEDVVKQLLPGQNVSEVRFIDAFTIKNVQDEIEEESLLKGIEDQPPPTTSVKNQSIYKQLKLNDFSPKSKETTPTYSRKVNNFLDSSEVKTPMFNQIKTSFQAQEKSSISYEPVTRGHTSENNQYKSNFDQIQNNITSVLDNIQQRRDRLRQDSLQRKKLIEDVMSRKKQLAGTSDWNDGLAKDWREKEQVNSSNNVKKVAKSYLNYNPTFYQAQQPTRNREDNYQYTPKRQQPLLLSNQASSLSYQRSCGHLKSSASPPVFTPYEPKRSAEQSSDISQILKKYTANVPEFKGEESTLKTLCKSKSGFIYENQTYTRDPSNWRREQQYDNSFSYSRGVSTKGRDNYKQNVMRRAEEEAAKKIEEIERKARMKVLEKKGRGEGAEWNRLAKHSINF